MNILGNLKIWQKLALVIAALSVPIVLLAYLLVTEMNISINLANKEIQGIKYLQPARALLQHFAEHRGMSNTYLNGDVSFREKIMSKRAQLDEDAKTLAAIHAQYGKQLDASDQWQMIKSDWKSLATDGFNLSAKESFTRHTALIKKLIDLITHVGIASA